MLTLSLLRHAKSSWDNPSLRDFDRALNERGRDAAPRMGAYMAAHDIVPELILCSPSVRTRQTLELVLPHFTARPPVLYEDAIYLGTPSALLKRIRKVDVDVKHTMIVAHDPGLHHLAMGLSGSGDTDLLQSLAEKFPTAALAVIVFGGRSWSKVQLGAGRLKHFMTPKRLP
ncbi:MAG: histidine phosphatase family protein [Sphingomonadales bacterium]|nr:histidine phosphatase family protein [Sphingomonadales bacterium]